MAEPSIAGDSDRIGPSRDPATELARMSTSAARTWPPAGSWIRRYFPRSGWATNRWHLFTGDAVWRMHWPGPSLETWCGYATGPMSGFDNLVVEAGEPAAPCRLCLNREAATTRLGESA
jgi:hypothetical protein